MALRSFNIQVLFEGGTTWETTFSQELEPDALPATRFYLGYSSERAKTRDLHWVTVGDIGYMPQKVMGVRIIEISPTKPPKVEPVAAPVARRRAAARQRS